MIFLANFKYDKLLSIFDLGGAAVDSILSISVAILLVSLLFISILFFIELFVFEKLFQKKGFQFVFNFGTLITNSELIKILSLLEKEGDYYHVQDRRITIYRYKWQFYFFYMIRLSLARISKDQESIKKLKTVMHWENEQTILAYSIDSFNLIDIFEFNIKACNKRNKKNLKAILLHTLFHEFRHRYQYYTLSVMKDYEDDANKFADIFFNKYNNEIKEILKLPHNVIFDRGVPTTNTKVNYATNS